LRSSSFVNTDNRKDGAKLIQWRKTKTDEEWVNLGAASDAEWVADAKKITGIEAKIS
jgi:hypothetical protein